MTLTRWKLMAGMLGLSIVGVVAVANPQCPNTKKDAAREAAPPGRVVPVKSVEVVPSLPETPTAPALPTFVPLADLAAAPQPAQKIDAAPPALDPPAAFKVDLALPTVAATPAKVDPPAPTAVPKLELPTPPPMPAQVVELPLPGVVAVKPVDPVPELPPAGVRPVLVPQPIPVDTKPAPVLAEPPPAPVPTPAKKVEATPVKKTAVSEEPAVKVMIHLGTGQPKFDVLAGDDVLLKAVCDNVDIRSPAEKGAGVTPLKAGGKVRFSAPGCEGTCDNLTVLPSTGEVELAGNVKVHCRMGKGETEINAATMKFKLGSAPAYAVPEPGVTSATFRE